MFDDQPEVSAEVKQLLNRVIKKQIAPLKVARIHTYGRDDGWEGGPTLEVEVEYVGKREDFDVELYGGIWSALLPKLEELGEKRWPIITFLSIEDVKDAVA